MTGKTSISGLTGLLRAFSLFVSSDSGPYHIGVALQTPTLAVFRWDNRAHYHTHQWVRCRIANEPAHGALLRADAEELLGWKRKHDSVAVGPAAGIKVT
jgi:ADP-heptose:LPS heptosyltransferase